MASARSRVPRLSCLPVPSLSILAGWWIEGWIEGETGRAIGEPCDLNHNNADRSACDAASLYDKLERVILPLFYHHRDSFTDVMRHCISLNGSVTGRLKTSQPGSNQNRPL